MSAIRQRPQNDLLIKHSAPADLCKVSILSRIAQALSEQAIKKTCQSYYFDILISNPVTKNTFSFNKFKKGDNSDSNQLLNSCNTKPKGTLMAQVQQTI